MMNLNTLSDLMRGGSNLLRAKYALGIAIPLALTPWPALAVTPALIAQEITAEATRPNNDPIGRPLPLAASWNTGTLKDGYDPNYQISMIEQGHYLLPWFQLDMPQIWSAISNTTSYYKNALTRCASLGLPISLVSTQWESLLTTDKKYFGIKGDSNPNVVQANGAVLPMISPFGPTTYWTEVGSRWTNTSVMTQLQSWYPSPPLVIFLSNNEHPKLVWKDANKDRRYVALNGSNTTDETKRVAVGKGWIDRYRALQTGFRNGLINPQWRQTARFVGYEAFGTSAFARWGGWSDYSLVIKNRIEPWPLAWDGASTSFYLFDWDPTTDFKVWSPQVAAMNWNFMLNQARALNSQFWYELSVWDGYQRNAPSDKRAYFAKLGQAYTPERYLGMVKFGMWLQMPRLVREYRGWSETRSDTEPYFLKVVQAVDEVHTNPILESFWRTGALVPNKDFKHPYQDNVPPEYTNVDRWFLLNTSADKKRPWNLLTDIPVFSIALVKGTAPNREWLVYAHSPLGAINSVSITIPGYGAITVTTRQSGTYFVVKETQKTINTF